MKGKILIASANPWSFCLAVERQFAREHAETRVDVLNLFALLLSELPGYSARDRALERLMRKIDRFVVPVVSGRDITGSYSISRNRIPAIPDTVHELRAYRSCGAAVGLGALSSAAEITSIFHVKSTAAFGPELERAWRTSFLSSQIGEFVAKLGYEKVLLFGGRHAHTRAFSDVIRRSAEVIFYEQGGRGDRAIYANRQPYTPEEITRIVERTTTFSRAAGERYFERRINRTDPGSAFFTARQSEGAIPGQLEKGAYVTYFTSSPDERFALREKVQFGDVETQGLVSLALARACNHLSKQLVIRMHPHLQYKHPSWKGEWDFEQLKRMGVLVLMPDEKWDSYALARGSHCVFTSGSTISLESTYLGIPNAVIGSGIPSALGASAQVEDEKGISQFISDPQLPEGARDRALLGACYNENGSGYDVHGLDLGEHPNFTRVDGRIVDPIRYCIQLMRKGASRLQGREMANYSGIVNGRVLLPTGPAYRKKALPGAAGVTPQRT